MRTKSRDKQFRCWLGLHKKSSNQSPGFSTTEHELGTLKYCHFKFKVNSVITDYKHSWDWPNLLVITGIHNVRVGQYSKHGFETETIEKI
jgi:hypothetical protein